MHIVGNYSIDGKIARMVIKGQGDFDLDICKLRYFYSFIVYNSRIILIPVYCHVWEVNFLML
jgi:hypothetical protein